MKIKTDKRYAVIKNGIVENIIVYDESLDDQRFIDESATHIETEAQYKIDVEQYEINYKAWVKEQKKAIATYKIEVEAWLASDTTKKPEFKARSEPIKPAIPRAPAAKYKPHTDCTLILIESDCKIGDIYSNNKFESVNTVPTDTINQPTESN